jgi:hypothetical protein
MSFEIKPIKCQSCGSGSLDFSARRVAKCSNCGTVHVIDGDADIADALSPIGTSQSDHSITIKIPREIAVGLFLREQGYAVCNMPLPRSISEWNNSRLSPDGWLHVGRMNSAWFSRIETVPICQLYFRADYLGADCVQMQVLGREFMPESERIIKLLRAGVGIHVDASLAHS